jgi:hypothetical protein
MRTPGPVLVGGAVGCEVTKPLDLSAARASVEAAAKLLRDAESEFISHGLVDAADVVWKARSSILRLERSAARSDEVSLMGILTDAETCTGVPIASILGRRQTGFIVRARDLVAYRLRAEMGWSYPAIGKALGRDHSSVLVAVRRHRRRTA